MIWTHLLAFLLGALSVCVVLLAILNLLP